MPHSAYNNRTAVVPAAMRTIQATVPILPYPIPVTDPAAAAFEVEDAAALEALEAPEAEDEGALPPALPELIPERVASVTGLIVTPVAFMQPPDPPAGPLPVTKLTAAHCEGCQFLI